MFSDHNKLRNEKNKGNHETLFNIFFYSSEVFYSITVKQTDKIFIEYRKYIKEKGHRKKSSISIRSKKIAFLQFLHLCLTDRPTFIIYRRDACTYIIWNKLL